MPTDDVCIIDISRAPTLCKLLRGELPDTCTIIPCGLPFRENRSPRSKRGVKAGRNPTPVKKSEVAHKREYGKLLQARLYKSTFDLKE